MKGSKVLSIFEGRSGTNAEGGVDGERSLRKVEARVGRTWNSRQRALWTRERPSQLSSMRGEEVEREGIREHAKKRRCNEITHHCPRKRGTPGLGHGQITARKG